MISFKRMCLNEQYFFEAHFFNSLFPNEILCNKIKILQKIIGQFTRDERLYDDEKIKNLAKKFPSENSPDGQRMIMYMLLFSWYTRNTVLPFTADQIVSLVDSIIDVYYNQEYQQMNNIMISLIRNDLQRMSFWGNEYVFKTFFNDDFIVDADGRMYVNLEKLSIFNKWILQNAQNVEFYNYSHLLVQKCNHLQYVHNYTIIVSDDVPQNVVQIHCPKCDILTQIPKDDFLKMCRNYEKSYAKFSQGISIYCQCDTQINFIRLYGNFKVLYGGWSYGKGYLNTTQNFNCDGVPNDNILKRNILKRQSGINNGKQAEWNSLQTTFEQFGAIVKNKKDKRPGWTYQNAQKWYNDYVDSAFNVTKVSEKCSFGENDRFIPDVSIENDQNDGGLKEILNYFAKQRAQHTDMIYYSGETFAKGIESQFTDLSGGTKRKIEKLCECLEFIQDLLNTTEETLLTLASDGINSKLQNSNYKLSKLFSQQPNIYNNDYYKTIYFVSNAQPSNNQQIKIDDKTKPIWIYKIPRGNILYISLCHGGIVIKIPSNGKSEILKAMIENIKFLLNEKCEDKYIDDHMKKFVISIAILSKYEKDAYENSQKFNQSTLRDDLYCIKQEKEWEKRNSFYKTFMQLYYNMLLWNEENSKAFKEQPIKYDSDKKTINDLRDTFIKFYENLEQDVTIYNNNVNYTLIFNGKNTSTKKPLKDKYLSFLMTLYMYNDQIKNIFTNIYKIPDTEKETKIYKFCKCLIDWVLNFVSYMLVNVYKYNENNLLNVRNDFLKYQEQQKNQMQEQQKNQM